MADAPPGGKGDGYGALVRVGWRVYVQWPARRAAASMILTFGPRASRKESSSSSSMIASPKPAAISMAVDRIRKNEARRRQRGSPPVLAAHGRVDRAIALGIGLAHVQEVGVSQQRALADDHPGGFPVRRSRPAFARGFDELLGLDEFFGRNEPDALDRGHGLDLFGVRREQKIPITRRYPKLLFQLIDERRRRLAKGARQLALHQNRPEGLHRVREITVQRSRLAQRVGLAQPPAKNGQKPRAK
jgi:hypothetical protein